MACTRNSASDRPCKGYGSAGLTRLVSVCGSAVSISNSSSTPPSPSRGGKWNGIGSWWALSRTAACRRRSARRARPPRRSGRRPGARPGTCTNPAFQASSDISLPVGLEPGDVLDVRRRGCARPWKNFRRWKHRLLLPDAASPCGRTSRNSCCSVVQLPVRARSARCPGSRCCCCPSACGPARRRRSSIGTPCEKQQRGDQVALLPLAQGVDGRVVGRPLGAAVPAVVVVGAVAVVLAVGLVVLVVVADQVVQREAVVAGDEVDAGVRPPAALLVQVAASRSAGWRTR